MSDPGGERGRPYRDRWHAALPRGAAADRSHATWMAYDLAPDGTLGGGRVFFGAAPWTRTKRTAPDDMKVDEGQGYADIGGPGPPAPGLHRPAVAIAGASGDAS